MEKEKIEERKDTLSSIQQYLIYGILIVAVTVISAQAYTGGIASAPNSTIFWGFFSTLMFLLGIPVGIAVTNRVMLSKATP